MQPEMVSITKQQFVSLMELSRCIDEGRSMVVSKTEYNELTQTARELRILMDVVVAAGFLPKLTAILLERITTSNPPAATLKESRTSAIDRRLSPNAPIFVPAGQPKEYGPVRRPIINHKPFETHFSSPPSPPSTCHDDLDDSHQSVPDITIENSYNPYDERRALMIKGLSGLTTLADVTNVIRGGAILNIYINPQGRSAHVTFVKDSAAEQFLNYSKKQDIYIRDKRVEVQWDDKQYRVPAFVARQINNNTGASRNLVMRAVKPYMTAESIRDDLEHIHRLEVIDIRYADGDAYVSTNSIVHALDARLCLKSRYSYKGTVIQWCPDPCEEPLPAVRPRVANVQVCPARSKTAATNFNRFQTLCEIAEESNDIDEDVGVDAFTSSEDL